jgi:hypothetical protein
MYFTPRHLTRELPLRQSAPLAGVSFVDFLATGNMPVFYWKFCLFFKKLPPVALKKWADQSIY